jgi:hypothetical protein
MNEKTTSTTNFRMLGASGHSIEERQADDFYATDPIAIDRLLKVHTIPDLPIWECACGEGHLSKRLTEHGYTTISTDLYDRGYGTAGVDFLRQTKTLAPIILTNPPYKYAQEFIEHALSLPDVRYVYMFLKLNFLESANRQELFSQGTLKHVFVAAKRIRCARNARFDLYKSTATTYAWFVWDKEYHSDPKIGWF